MVKKNTCDATEDKVIYIENHYASEMFFMADPEGTKEDDGVLETIVFDGEMVFCYHNCSDLLWGKIFLV